MEMITLIVAAIIPATRQVLLIVIKPPLTGDIEDYVLAAPSPSAATIMVNGASAEQQRLALPTNIVIVPTIYVTMRAPTSMVKPKPPKRASAEQILANPTNIVIVPTIYVTIRAPTSMVKPKPPKRANAEQIPATPTHCVMATCVPHA